MCQSLADAESMCQKPTWCWEHVPIAYLMLRTCAQSLLDRAWVVPPGCGGRALICRKSALSFQGVSCRYSCAFTRSPSVPLETRAWSGCEKADSIIFVLFTLICSFIFLLKLSTSGAMRDLSGCELKGILSVQYPSRSCWAIFAWGGCELSMD